MKTSKKLVSVILSLTLACACIAPAAAFAADIYTDTKACNLAVKKVGKGARVIEVDADYDASGTKYEIDLLKGKKKYSLSYLAKGSKLVEYGWELRSKAGQKKAGKNVSKAAIKKIAVKKVKGAKVTSVKRDHDDGLTVYEVKLKKGDKVYSLEYNAKSKSLLEYKWEIKSKKATSKYIGLSKAKKIALDKVPGATIVKAEFDMDDGIPVYEVELVKGSWEYEVVIHAKSGKILEYDEDWR